MLFSFLFYIPPFELHNYYEFGKTSANDKRNDRMSEAMKPWRDETLKFSINEPSKFYPYQAYKSTEII